jgi:hypothetical protein
MACVKAWSTVNKSSTHLPTNITSIITTNSNNLCS